MKKKKTQTPKAGKLAMLSTLLHGSRYLFVFGILASLCTTLLTALIPRVVGVTVDSIVGDKAPDYPFLLSFFGGREYLRGHLYVVALLLLAVGVLCALCRYGSFWFNAKGAETLSRNMREKLYAKVVRLPLSWHSSNHTGDIIQRCTSDTELLRTFIADQLTGLVNTVIVIFISLVMVFTLCPTLALVTLVTVPVVVSYSLIFYFKCAGLFTEYDENEGKLSAIAQENLTGSRVVKAFGREAYERDKFDRQNRYYTTRGMRLCRVLSLYWGVGDFVTGAQMLAVLVFGAYIAVSGAFGGLSAGNYISFLSYNAMMIWPVRSLGRMISEMSKAGVAVERIAYVMNAEEEKDTGKKPFVPGDICFDHVSFSYGESQVLQDVSFTLKQGEVLGILGGTGSGKSTLLLLLCKLYTPSAGRITVGGVDIADISTASLRQGIGMVMQEPFLFSGTLSENIHITATQPDMAAVRAAAAS